MTKKNVWVPYGDPEVVATICKILCSKVTLEAIVDALNEVDATFLGDHVPEADMSRAIEVLEKRVAN